MQVSVFYHCSEQDVIQEYEVGPRKRYMISCSDLVMMRWGCDCWYVEIVWRVSQVQYCRWIINHITVVIKIFDNQKLISTQDNGL